MTNSVSSPTKSQSSGATIGASKAKRGRFAVAPKAARSIDGITFASKREMNRYLTLKAMEDRGEINRLELQPAFPVLINGQRYCVYHPDFQYERGGEIVIEDCKSSGTAKDTAYRLRKRATELFYGVKIVEVSK